MKITKTKDEIIITTENVRRINIKELQNEKKSLEGGVKPTDQELIEYGKLYHPYYDPYKQERLKEINDMLKWQ